MSHKENARSIQWLIHRRIDETFASFETKFDGCTVVLEPLTRNTYVLIVSADPAVG